MSAKVTFFPVGNGDMTLITLIDDTNISPRRENPFRRGRPW